MSVVSGGALAYGAAAGLVVYYAATLQLSYAGSQRSGRVWYGLFFVLSMVTVVIEVLQILLKPTDWVSHTAMFYGVVGPLLDLSIQSWPGNGAMVLLTSQFVFAVHNTPELGGVAMIVVTIFTAAVTSAGWWHEKRSVVRKYRSEPVHSTL